MLEISKIFRSLMLFCFSFALGSVVLSVNSNHSYAQSTAGCATDTWTAMTNRAAMETRREDVMNKRYIVKADSVLQYSCFIDELGLVIDSEGGTSGIFSNSDVWANRTIPLTSGGTVTTQIYAENTEYEANYIIDGTILGIDSMALAIANVVGNFVSGPLLEYMAANFNHLAISGTTSYANAPRSTPHPDPVFCHNMASIWTAAKCKNFNGTAEFYSFERLADVPNIMDSFDPREFPPNMLCDP